MASPYLPSQRASIYGLPRAQLLGFKQCCWLHLVWRCRGRVALWGRSRLHSNLPCCLSLGYYTLWGPKNTDPGFCNLPVTFIDELWRSWRRVTRENKRCRKWKTTRSKEANNQCHKLSGQWTKTEMTCLRIHALNLNSFRQEEFPNRTSHVTLQTKAHWSTG